MGAIRGRVENGVVRLRNKKILSEGQKVIVVPLPGVARKVQISPEAHQEDLEFVRATRGRRARHLTADDAIDA